MMPATLWLLLSACAIAVATDVTRRRIPNWLTGGLALAALAFHATHGPLETLQAAFAMLGVLFVGLLAFTSRLLGGGDVKLLAAAAAAVGYPDCITLVVYTTLAGGVLALVYAGLHRRLAQTLRGTGAMLLTSSYRVSAVAVPARGSTLPYAIAIASGAVILALAKTVAPSLRLPL